jgi:hypothetical protein
MNKPLTMTDEKKNFYHQTLDNRLPKEKTVYSAHLPKNFYPLPVLDFPPKDSEPQDFHSNHIVQRYSEYFEHIHQFFQILKFW